MRIPAKEDVLASHINKNDSLVVFAWGGNVPVPESNYMKRLTQIKQLLDSAAVKPNHVGALSYGKYPRHGRMWNKGNRNLSVLDWKEIIV